MPPTGRHEPSRVAPGSVDGLCGCPCPQGLAVRQCPETAPNRCNPQYRTVQADLGEKLGARGARGGEMENLNWGYIQLGLVALAFGGLQVWWIGSVFWKRKLARPLNEGEFRKALERIWTSEK